jgi:hypothetical protein
MNRDNNTVPIKLEKICPNKDDYFNALLVRYHKLFLVISKGLNQPKHLKKNDYQAIFKYM